MRSSLCSLVLAALVGVSCGLFDDASERLDSSQAEAVCGESCDRQLECDAEFDAGGCHDNCGASVAAWYLCADAPEIADYIEMCNEMSCDDVSSCLQGRPEC